MASSKMFVCNIFGEVLDGERDHPRAPSDDQCYQPPGLRQTFQGPKPTLPASENFDLTGSTSPRDFDFEVKVEPPDNLDPTLGNPFDDDTTVDFQVKEEAIMLEDVKIEVSSSSEGNPTSEDETFTVNHGAAPSKKGSKNREREPRLIRESQEHACEECAFKSKSKRGLTQHIRKFHQSSSKGSRGHACYKCAFKSQSKGGLSQHIKRFHQPLQQHACKECAFKSKSKSGLTLHIRKFHRRPALLDCEFCGSKFRTDKALSLHLRTHNGKKKYVCYSCKYTCTGRNNLKRHIAKIHREVKCTICDYRADRIESMKKHLLIHEKSQEHACYKCDFKSKYRRGLTQHIRKFHQRPALLDCEFCGSKFRTDKALSLHLRTHNGKKKYVCYSCKLICTRRNSLKRHIAKIHTDVKCTICDYRADRVQSMKKHLLFHEKKTGYKCHACPYKCNRRMLIKRHLLNIHTVSQVYACEKCVFTSKSKTGLAVHKWFIHQRFLPCEFCGNKFRTYEALSSHLRTHNGEKQYECYHCKYTCYRRNMIKTHIAEKHPVIKCPWCDHRTNCSASMRKHFLLLHEREMKPFACTSCGFKTHLMTKLNMHLRKHRAAGAVYKCHYCQAYLRNRHLLKLHIFRKHLKESPYACKMCDKRFTRRDLLILHIRAHKGETPFACNSCCYKTHLQQRLHEHIKRKHSEGAAYHCHYCQAYLPNRFRLKNHIFKKHLKESAYACKMCDKRYTKREFLIGHIRAHKGETPFACNSCSFKTILQQRLNEHMKIKHSERWYECERCSYKTPVEHYLKRHRKVKHWESLSCDVCGFSTPSTFRMKVHMNAHSFMEFYPNLEQPFHCIRCPFKTHSMTLVGEHLKKHKLREKTSICHICGFLPTSHVALKSHLRIHSEEKPYACHLCDYKCRHGVSLTKHIRSHLGLKPFACKECDYKGRAVDDLKRHMMVHTGEKKFACEFCDYRAAQRVTYRKHVMTHTGNKPHACNICSYKGAARSDLNRHMMTHTGDKTFKCKACRFKTVTRATFEKHIVKHKGMKKYICLTCKQIRYGRERFKKHLNSHTGDKEYVCYVCRYKCSRRREIKFHFECANEEGSHWPVLSKYLLLSKCKTD